MMIQVLGPLTPAWKFWMEFLTPWLQPRPAPFGNGRSLHFSLSLYPSLSLYLENKLIISKMFVEEMNIWSSS